MDIKINGYINLQPFEKGFKLGNSINLVIDGKEYFIPEGLTTDLGSIPVLFRSIFPRFGLETIAYLIHDYGYREQPEGTTRQFWDNVLLQLLKESNINYFKRYSIYWNLRAFGWMAWNENKKILKGDLFG